MMAVSPNDKIRIGCIGVGNMGRGNMNGFMKQPEVEVVAVCDVDSENLSKAASAVMKAQHHMPSTHKDFREVLDMKDVDAVMIATPDHWHALPFIMACEAGKDIFCEKPISHDVYEGQMMVGAAKYHKRVVQINTWQRSRAKFRDAMDFIREGGAGTVRICRAWVTSIRGLGKNPIKDPPANLDWDFWCGPAPKVAYHDNIHPRWWRLYFDFGTGLAGDWGVHMIDIILQAMGDMHPLEVSSVGGKIMSGEDDDRTTPDTQIAVFKFKDFVMNWELHTVGEGLDEGPSNHGSEFIGDKGKLIVDRAKGITWKPYGDHPGPEAKNTEHDHIRDFLDNMRSRGKCASDIESMYCTTTCCHLMNVSYQIGRSVTWDGENGVIVSDKKAMEANAFRRDYRKPWKLPYYKWNA
jgi:predicted dehydrogenase